MSTRRTYHVTKTDDGWQSKLEGGQRASIIGDTKAEVIKKMAELANNQGNTSVKIHKGDETFEEERTYSKKTDPFPPEG